MSHVLSSYARRIADKARTFHRKLTGTAKVALDRHVPVVTFYDYNPNWGDALNRVLVRHISGREPVAAQDVYALGDRPVYSVIGSILGNSNLPNIEVWGSGFIGADRTFLTPPRRIHAVRGPLTRQLVLKQGLPCPAVYGDPALLYPRYYAPALEKKYDLGIVAHYTDRDAPWVHRTAREANALIVDVFSGVEEFVDQICRCRVIASSSLHGLIAADAYGIPFTWISLLKRVIGDGFKFQDYFLSTGRKNVECLEISEDTSFRKLYDFVTDSGPEIDLDLLLQACPFRTDTVARREVSPTTLAAGTTRGEGQVRL
jgi:pyruvyltransferase